MEVVYFTLVALLLYAVSDWLLQRLEMARGKRFEHRSLIFFGLLLSFALLSFALIRHLGGQ